MNRRTVFIPLMMVAVLLCPVSATGQDVQVTSTFDKRSVNIDGEIHLTIRVKGADGNIQAPRLPSFRGFDTFYTGRASHLSFVNGQSSSTVEFNYLLVPTTAGRFTLDPIQVNINGKIFQTDPIEVEVMGNGGRLQRSPSRTASAPPPASAPAAGTPPAGSVQPPAVKAGNSDPNIFVQAWLDKQTVYPNEQVLLTYSLYTRLDTRYEGFEEEPSVSGFWIEEFPMERDIDRETVRVDGRRYVKADVRKMALFPTAAADYTIKPGKLRASIRQQPQQTSIFDDFFDDSFFSGGSFFARRENRLLTPGPIHLEVKPLPEDGRPETFQGAVGNFTLDAGINKSQVPQNEPVTVTVTLEGQGNVETLNKPVLPDLPAFKVYEADTSTQLFKKGNVIGGKKTFEIVFIPREAGEMAIPPLEFSFFNPQAEKYQTLRTRAFPLRVSPTEEKFKMPDSLSQEQLFKKGVKVEGRDIRFIREYPENGMARRVFSGAYYGIIGLNGLLTLLLFAGFWKRRQDAYFSRNKGLRRRKFAKNRAVEGMKRLGAAGEKESVARYFEEVDKILSRYLADKFDLSALGHTRLDLERKLEETLGPDDDVYRQVLELYRICDESRFGGFSHAEEKKNQARQIIKKVIQRLEKVC